MNVVEAHPSEGWTATWREALLSFWYPEVCQLCTESRARSSEGYVCRECRRQLALIESPYCARCGLPFAGEITGSFQCSNCNDLSLEFEFARSVIAAKGRGLDLIHRFKYHRALWLEPLFEELFRQHAAPSIAPSDWDALVPVPLHRIKAREREFNQAERLASILGRLTGIPVQSNLVHRITPTATQTTLSREHRALNVRNAFQCPAPLATPLRRLLLIDDVMTTGATTHECARALRKAGAERVGVWTLARGL